MSAHTSFQIGGPADAWVRIQDVDELAELVFLCNESKTPYLVVGGGNNLLVRDGGIEGLVLHLEGSLFGGMERVPEGLRLGAGVRLERLVGECMRMGWTGLEFLVAIPGTVGGAVRMNAGTRDISVSERVLEVTVLDPNGAVRVLKRDAIPFGYRRSGLEDAVVLEAVFSAAASSPASVRAAVIGYWEKKHRTQDLVTPSAGSIFKNGPGGLVPSARLIEQSGLKGLAIGQARVSPIHANFIVNEGGARAQDVEELIAAIRDKVRRDHDVELELEVMVVGRFAA
ncbi:MAG: UDP-N-acetylmuramate dehydrogenase [Candidatus Omnitrophica bacterium]|nr:UDP-N-acetylmuramate dehydrogenase [Candidatus Omnitrophota bacterium]